jgi:hypothetical protein
MKLQNNRWEDLDKAALNDALLALRTCPNCRGDLQPVAFFDSVWGCKPCKETWYLPEKADPRGRCRTCGEVALDGKATCGRIEC